MKIGIIGSGGAGMCTAWLLDQGHDLTLIEKKDYLGGNTHTVDVEINGILHHVDDGANWFSPSIYPHFNRLLELVDIPFDWVPLSMTYYNKLTGKVNAMPPVTFRRIIQMFAKPHVLPELLLMNKVVNASQKIVDNHETDLTLREFMDSLNLSDKQRNQFLMPLLSGVWGSPHDQTEDFSVYPLMKYLVYHKPSGLKYFDWKVMRGGVKNYIKMMADTLKNTQIIVKDGVKHIQPNTETGKVHVTTESGKTFEFDKLIITAGAKDAQTILKDTEHIPEVQKALSKFQYYKATVCTHSDTDFMPPNRKDWSVVNVLNKGSHADATIWDGWNTNQNVFDSYINEGDDPKNVHHVSEWWLPCETPDFFRAQKELEKVQGTHNIYFGGDYTHDIGSHEDAIDSAIENCKRIWLGSERLNDLTNC
ncbi:MAG: FAD-dependent oxidoreductase [Flavobacteriales bacterium]|nr:FAD-dependent oxidoreductase [Flavobacteriales bacterium]